MMRDRLPIIENHSEDLKIPTEAGVYIISMVLTKIVRSQQFTDEDSAKDWLNLHTVGDVDLADGDEVFHSIVTIE
jgi:hypothetical protein